MSQGTETHEDQRPARGPNTVTRIFSIRLDIELMNALSDKAKAEKVGLFRLINRVLWEYAREVK